MSYETLINDLEALTKQAKKQYDNRTDPDAIYELLKTIIEGYANKSVRSSEEKGGLRNEGVEEVCRQLNRLQQDYTFQEDYNVGYYVRKKRD